MQKKVWMTSILLKEFLSFFKRSILQEEFHLPINRHLLIMDGHDSLITLEAIEQAHEFGLYMVTFPTHTSHVLQPLDAICFKPFKINFRKETDVTMSKSNYMEPNKITLARWVD